MKAIQITFLAVVIGFAGAAAASDKTPMTVFKTPWCGCCHAWVEIMRAEGFDVTVRDLEDLEPIKKQAGIADNLQSCHTAVAGDYVIEGHVPPAAVKTLLKERPAVRGLSVPGMPAGSPGMGDDPSARYGVYAFSHDPGKPPQIYLEVGK